MHKFLFCVFDFVTHLFGCFLSWFPKLFYCFIWSWFWLFSISRLRSFSNFDILSISGSLTCLKFFFLLTPNMGFHCIFLLRTICLYLWFLDVNCNLFLSLFVCCKHLKDLCFEWDVLLWTFDDVILDSLMVQSRPSYFNSCYNKPMIWWCRIVHHWGCFRLWPSMRKSIWFYMLVTIFVVGLILFLDHVVIGFAGWWKQLFTMTLLFISQNSTSLNPLSFLLPLKHWPMQFSNPFLFLIFALKSPVIAVLDVYILSILFFFFA